MEIGKVQDMKRRGKGGGGNKRSAGDKSEGGKRQKNTNIIYVFHHAYTVLFETIFHILAARLPDHPAESPHFHTKTDKGTVSGTLNSFRNPRDGQVQRPSVQENKKCHCLC
jgi:hypothetical protein